MHQYRDAGRIVKWLSALFIVNIALCLVAAMSEWMEFSLLQRLTVGEDVTETEATLNDLRQAATGVLRMGVLIPIVVLFCIWVNRANKNARALGAADMRFTPGWSVAYFFIPIVNLFRPYQAVTEIYKASDPRADRTSWKAFSAPSTGWWWAAYLISSVIGQAAVRMSLRAESLDELQTAAAVGLVSDFVEVPAAVAAIVVVRNIQSMQTAKVALPGVGRAGLGHQATE